VGKEGVWEMKEELKPCPFCGKKAKLHRLFGLPKFWKVSCKNFYCAGMTKCYREKQLAIAAWNKRVTIENKREGEKS
jgi:Lar family restriction alleviation protein